MPTPADQRYPEGQAGGRTGTLIDNLLRPARRRFGTIPAAAETRVSAAMPERPDDRLRAVPAAAGPDDIRGSPTVR